MAGANLIIDKQCSYLNNSI